MLSGHTHGGQVRVPLVGPRFSALGPQVYRGLVPLWRSAALRQSRPRHRRSPSPVQLPAGDYAFHAALRVSWIRFAGIRARHRHAPAIVMPSMRSVGEATDPRKIRSVPIAVTLRSISARFPAIVTSSTACVRRPFDPQAGRAAGSRRSRDSCRNPSPRHVKPRRNIRDDLLGGERPRLEEEIAATDPRCARNPRAALWVDFMPSLRAV